MRTRLAWCLVAAALLVMPAVAQSGERFPDHLHRDDLATAGDLDGAVRVLRFAQVTDMQLVDDDAPAPIRQAIVDEFWDGTGVSDGAYRPQEELGDEIMAAMGRVLAAHHDADAFDFVIHTGDNIDNALENELMRYLDIIRGTHTTVGPLSGFECLPDGQSGAGAGLLPDPLANPLGDDPNDNDVVDSCTSLPEHMVGNTTPIDHIPWYSMVGNHDVLIQGNVPLQPGFQELAANFGRYFLQEDDYLAMHFDDLALCVDGTPAGNADDDWGHGFGLAGQRLCDDDPDNDGYYAFDLRGVRFIVLNTVNDEVYQTHGDAGGEAPHEGTGYDHAGGLSQGAIDAAQFEWLQGELNNSDGRLAVIVGHHTVNAFYEATFDDACGPPGCATDALAAAGFVGRDGLLALLAEHPNAVTFVGGHTHQHRVQPKPFDNATSAGFWNIETSGLLDLPQESRILELWITADGQGAWVLTPLGHDFQAALDAAAEDGQHDAETATGTAADRDVVLWFDLPSGVGLSAGPQPGGTPDATPLASLRGTVALTGDDGADAVLRQGRHHVVAGNVTLTVNMANEDGSAVDGLALMHAGERLGALGAGRYQWQGVVALGNHDWTIRVTDGGGQYAPLDLFVALTAVDADNGVTSTGSGPQGGDHHDGQDDDNDAAGPGVLLAIAALAALAIVVRRRV